MSNSIGLITTMTWDQAEDLTKKDRLIFPSVRKILFESKFGPVSMPKRPYWASAIPFILCGFSIMACALNINQVVSDIGLWIGISCGLAAFVSPVIIDLCWFYWKKREVVQHISESIKNDKKNPNRPMLAALLAQDLKKEKESMTATTNRIKNIKDALPEYKEKK